ncbi:MAG: cell envelope integrity protein CreD [Sulfurovum sp.]|nr:cell envelope integrity protein CreD [Sulfurovum sp.]
MEKIIALILGLVVLLAILIGFFIIVRWLYGRISEIGEKTEIQNYEEKKMINMSSFKNSIGVRFVIIGIIALVMMIPLAKVSQMVYERSTLHQGVLNSIAFQWGKPQVVMGPALILPIVEKYNITEKVADSKGNEKIESRVVYRNKNIVILPKVLNKNIGLQEHYRYRGIYRSLVYTSDVEVDGKFILPDISKLSDNIDKVRYDKAYMLMGLSDTKAIEHVSSLSFGSNSYSFDPGTRLNLKGILSGFHAPLELSEAQKEYTFKFNLKANGSSYIRFSAFGEQTIVKIHSSWKHPSFQGAILPMDRNISEQGFVATWKIPSLARNFPQSWISEDNVYAVNKLLAGVDLYEPIALYSLVERSVKYGALFILLTFLTFLIFEMTQKSKLHYVQYILIGSSLGLFFLILLSLSEHILFFKAYISASALTILSISTYAWFSNKSAKQFFTILTLLAALYALLYSILQLEDYALLMGTGLLIVTLFVLMWVTRNLKVSEE